MGIILLYSVMFLRNMLYKVVLRNTIYRVVTDGRNGCYIALQCHVAMETVMYLWKHNIMNGIDMLLMTGSGCYIALQCSVMFL